MKQILIVQIIIALSVSFSFAQQNSGRKFNAFSGTMVLSVEGGPTFANTDYTGLKVDYLAKTSLEYFLPSYTRGSFGFRLFGGGGFISGKDLNLTPTTFRTKLSFAGGGVIYALSINDEIFPYLFAGASYLWFDPKGPNGVTLPNNAAGNYTKHELDYNGELGFRILLTDNLSFNINGGIQISPNDNLDDKTLGTSNDMFYYVSAGFSFSFFTEFDSDNDGVVDSKDLCPDTPSGIKVDKHGCPLDSDGDGVPDYLDKCEGTPAGVKVDKTGCPLDSDGDGVADYRDICPNTPHGVKVDEIGCPVDSDGDGVPDYEDKCPDTPKNVQVDKHGCPIDSDLDGVPDYKDKCPNTPAGTQVDSSGCPKEKPVPPKPEIRQVVLSAGASFEFGSTKLRSSSFTELNNLVAEMKRNPLSRWRIVGFTDNVGSARANKKISLERAKSVLKYFEAHGISRLRFEISGMGESHPIASNKTEAGRAKNRRVEITRIN